MPRRVEREARPCEISHSGCFQGASLAARLLRCARAQRLASMLVALAACSISAHRGTPLSCFPTQLQRSCAARFARARALVACRHAQASKPAHRQAARLGRCAPANLGVTQRWGGGRKIADRTPKPRAILKIEVARRASSVASHEAAGRLTREPPRPPAPSTPAKQLFTRRSTPFAGPPRSIGGDFDGCLAGAVSLPLYRGVLHTRTSAHRAIRLS